MIISTTTKNKMLSTTHVFSGNKASANKKSTYLENRTGLQQLNKPIHRQTNCLNMLIFLAQLSPINNVLYSIFSRNLPQGKSFPGSSKANLPFALLLPGKSCIAKAKVDIQKIEYPQSIAAFNLAKEMSSRQKRLYLNGTLIDKADIFTNVSHTAVSYTPCTRSNARTLNSKKISKKLTKQIENFRGDVQLLMPLNLLISRNFLDHIGINYVSAFESRLAKLHYSLFSKNLLFTRTSKNVLESNYMNKQTGLIRSKDALFFDFSYTKDSLVKLGLKKTNKGQSLETGHKQLWLRKISSIRL
jgi:hypothetical protein